MVTVSVAGVAVVQLRIHDFWRQSYSPASSGWSV
jgi:hypothetical protein